MVYTVSATQLARGLTTKPNPLNDPKAFPLSRTIEILQHPDSIAVIKKNSDFLTAHTFWLPLEVKKLMKTPYTC